MRETRAGKPNSICAADSRIFMEESQGRPKKSRRLLLLQGTQRNRVMRSLGLHHEPGCVALYVTQHGGGLLPCGARGVVCRAVLSGVRAAQKIKQSGLRNLLRWAYQFVFGVLADILV